LQCPFLGVLQDVRREIADRRYALVDHLDSFLHPLLLALCDAKVHQVRAACQRVQHVLDGMLNRRCRLADGRGRLQLHHKILKLFLLGDVFADAYRTNRGSLAVPKTGQCQQDVPGCLVLGKEARFVVDDAVLILESRDGNVSLPRIGEQQLDALTDQLLPRVTERLLCSPIHRLDEAFRVHGDDDIGGVLDDSFQVLPGISQLGLMSLDSGSHVVDRLFHQTEFVVSIRLEPERKIISCHRLNTGGHLANRLAKGLPEHDPEGHRAQQDGGQGRTHERGVEIGSESIDPSQGIFDLEKSQDRSGVGVLMAFAGFAAGFVHDWSDDVEDPGTGRSGDDLVERSLGWNQGFALIVANGTGGVFLAQVGARLGKPRNHDLSRIVGHEADVSVDRAVLGDVLNQFQNAVVVTGHHQLVDAAENRLGVELQHRSR